MLQARYKINGLVNYLNIITFINQNRHLLNFKGFFTIMIFLYLVEVNQGGIGGQLGDRARWGLDGGWQRLTIGAQRCAVGCCIEQWLDVGPSLYASPRVGGGQLHKG